MSAFIFRGNYGLPYRAPGSGWFTPRKWYVGSPWQHYKSADAAYNAYANTTLVYNPNCGNHYGYTGETACADCSPAQADQIPPFRLPNPLNVLCTAPTASPCGTGTDLTGLPTYPGPLDNTYALKVPASTVNKAVCRKTGFKIVYAAKAWHGVFPFGDVDQCNACPATDTGNQQATPTLTKYLKMSWTTTATNTDGGGNVVSETMSGYMVIDRYSGKRSGSYTFADSIMSGGPGEGILDPGMPIRVFAHSDGDILPEDLLSLRQCNGVWQAQTSDESITALLQNIVNGLESAGGWTVVTASQTDTVISIDLEQSSGGVGGISLTATITLSEPYTSDDVNADVNGLLGWWDLSDAALYPWRNDAMCSRGPLVTYWENGATMPSIYNGGDYLSGPDWTWTPSGSGQGSYSYSFTNTIPDTSPQDGRILGKPNPYGPGADPWWDSMHQIYGINGSGHVDIFYWGDSAPTYCPGATQWTDDVDAASLLPGASASFNFLTDLANEDETPPYKREMLVKSKWAEVILLTAPSHNYGRPWGYRDSLLRDQTTVDCTGDPTYADQYGNLLFPTCPGIDGQVTITAATNASPIQLSFSRPTGLRTGDKIDVSGCLGNTAANGSNQTITVIDDLNVTIDGSAGNGAYTGSGIAISHGAPTYEWNDNQPKGDWCLITWANDFRTPATIAPVVSQQSSSFLPCCPAVVYITPQDGSQPVGETNGSNNSQSFPHPNLDCDSCYGSLWQSMPKQWMTDPLWQRPVKPCDKTGTMDDGMAWTEDDGSGLPDQPPPDMPALEYFPQRPWEECRAEPPIGAPALPFGFSMIRNDCATGVPGCDPGTQPPSAPGPGTPPNGYWMVPWIWSANRILNVQLGHRFSCDYADPMAVCSDNSESSPL